MIAKEALIYAKGGGEGHFTRGRLLRSWLQELDIPATLVVREDQIIKLPKAVSSIPSACSFTHVFVDTFPRGWRDELGSIRSRYPKGKLFLVRRFGRELSPEKEYNHLLSPYPEKESEWEGGAKDNEAHLGWICREIRFESKKGKLLILDSGRKLPTDLLAKMQKHAQSLGFEVEVLFRWNENTTFQGEKVFVVGAGYNNFYEWLRTGVDAVFLPLSRRWDDQYARARKFGRSMENLKDWEDWLEKSIPTKALDPILFARPHSLESFL
jgi:hypothetical protein